MGIVRVAAAVATLACGVAGTTLPAAAQSNAWTTQLLVPPFASSFVSEWERNPQNLTLGVTYLGTAPAEYRIEGTLTGAARGTIARASSPLFSVDAGPVTELYTGDDLLDWNVEVTRSSAEDAWRSGVIPDDDYEICVRLVNTNGIQLNESCASFLVELPEAPQLLFPSDGDGVNVFQPTFQWTPVVLREQLGIDYRVTIVERYPGQIPVAAIDANLPLYQESVGEAPLLVYPIDAVQLEPGKEYVWQVEVLDGFGDPLVPGGLFSPPQLFTTSDTDAFGRRLGEDGSFPESLPLVPGLATLTDLAGLEVESTQDGWLLNGQAWLDLDGPYGVRGRVRVEDLLMDDFGGFLSPADGRVVARLESPLPVQADLPVTVGELTYTPDEGLLAVASLVLPGGATVPLDGELQVTLGGLFGEVSTLEDQEIWRGGEDPVEVALTRASVTFPSGAAVVEGQAALFGGLGTCGELRGSVATDGSWSVSPLCVPATRTEVSGENPVAAVTLTAVTGPLSVNLETGALEYSLDARARVDAAPEATTCSIRFSALASSDAGVSFSGVDPSCDASRARMDAGWLTLGLSGLELAELTYTPGTGFDVSASLDVIPSLPGFPDFELPTLADVQLDASGISLPAATWNTPQAGLDLAGFGLSVASVNIPAVRIDWGEWAASQVGEFAVEFDADLSMPGLPSSAPTCLAAAAPLVTGGAIRGGVLTVEVEGAAGLSADCEVEVAPGVVLALSGFAGPVRASLGTAVAPGLRLTQGLGVTGTLLLGDPFVCAPDQGGVELTSNLELEPRGRISGRAGVTAAACPMEVAGIALQVGEGEVRMDWRGAELTALLEADVEARPASPEATGPVGEGRLTVDLVSGEIADGEVLLQGPISLPVPADSPVFTFVLDRAVLDAEGLLVDGRQSLQFPDGATMGATFVEVRVAPAGDGIRSGSVLFDSEFALDGGVTPQGGVEWAAVSPETPFDLASGFRVSLPAQMALTTEGLSVDGTGQARLFYDGRQFGGAGLSSAGDEETREGDADPALQGIFRSDFTLGLSPVAVAGGFLDLQLNGSRVAWVDDTGFHPDFVAFGAALLPTRLPLPTEEVAYLELRDEQGALRIQEEQVEGGLRIFSAPGTTVPLVFPSLDTDGTGAPVVDVTLDLTLASGQGLQVASGELLALVDPVAQPELDLSRSGIPFQIRELVYANPEGAGYGWLLTGDPVLQGEPVPGGSVVLAIQVPELPAESPRLLGLVDVPWVETLDLVPGSSALRFEHQRMTGGFDVALADGSGTWQLALDGELRLDLDGGGGLGVGAVLEASQGGLSFSSIDVDAQAPPFFFDAGLLELGVSELAVPVLDWDEGTGWDFEVEFDLAFRLPGLGGVETGSLPDLRLTPSGLDLPAITLTDFGGGFDLAGFRGSPLALRLPSVSLDPFSGGSGLDVTWDPRLDFTLSLSEAGAIRWPALTGLSFTVLDASWGLDGFTGSIEPRSLLQPIRLDFGLSGLALELGSFGGSLGVVEGVQDVSLLAGGNLVLPESLRCPASPDPVLALPGTSLELLPDGGFGGRLEDASFNCPLTLGPLEVALTDADLVFAFTEGVQLVNLFSDGTLTLPGTAPNTTVSATGSLDVALLEPRVIGGSIAVTQPFRWEIPADDPFLAFNVNQAVLDSRGFVLDGSGTTRLPDGSAGPSVTFAALTFDAAGDISAGSATVQAGLALDGALSGSTVDWALADPALPLAGDGFRLGLSGSATLSPSGLGLAGNGTAQLAFNDSTFAALDVDFSGGFTLAAVDARVSSGRADFALNNTAVAYVTPQGFFPGDIFGVVPLPERIPLPTADVAYLQVRDPQTGTPLVETAAVADGVSLATRQNETVELVLTSVLDGNGNPVTLPVSFNVVANGSSYALVSGSIEAVDEGPTGLFSLEQLGVPLAVTRVAFDSQTGAGPVLDARLRLPQSLNGLDVRFNGLAVTADGLAGEAVLGSLDPNAPTSAPPVAQATLGALDFRVDGARAVFGGGQSTPGVTLAGSFSSGFFRDPNGTVPGIDFTASVDAAGSFDVQTDASSLANGRIPISQALLQLAPVGISPPVAVVATDQSFSLAFSGILTLPNLAPDFAVTVAGLSVGTGGVSMAGAGVTLGNQDFELFGAGFSLRQTSLGPALGLSVAQNRLVLAMNGDVDFLGQTFEFRGLELDTDGRVGMASAALTGDSIPLVPDAVILDRLAVENSALRADLSIDLPAPFDGAGTQEASFTVAADGTVGGGGLVTLLEETRGLGGQRTQIDGTLATAHLRYLGLRLTPGQSNPGSVEMVGDFYLAGREQNRIGLGSHDNNSVDPGLSLDLDGSVRWGAVSLANEFSFDFDVLRLDVRNVAVASSSAEQITVGFGGDLQVDVRVVTGGLGFSDFRVGPNLSLETAAASIRNGNLAIAGVIGLNLNQFQYSATPTTISGVQGGLVPDTTGTGPAAQAQDIAVQSVLRFGGSLSIGGCVGSDGDCLFSGGVDEFLFYRTPENEGGLTNLVVRGANLEIPGLAMNADLRYEELDTGGGFEIVLGGSAEFQSRTVSVVGALEKPSNGDIRAGIFVLSSQRIEIIPVVLALTEVGGGFFYNPKPEYCQLVREYAGVQDLSSNGTSCEEVGRFTGFLYAGAELVEQTIGRAQVLLTISNTYVQLDGQMAFLSPGTTPVNEARIRGTVFLKVGIGKLYAEGNVAVNVDYDPLLTSADGRDMGEMGFFVYGEDAWGLYGGVSVEVLGLIRGDAEIMVGPPGFYMEGSIQAGFDFWIISVSGKASAAVWKVTDSWGAYLSVGVKAEILGGAISASATLRGALVSPANQPILVYAGALARGCVFGLCGEEEIWAKFQGGRVSGGFGSNSTFDSVIAEARRAREEFEAAKTAMLDKIAAAQLLAGLVLSDEELAAIYSRVNEGGGGLFAAVNRAISAERDGWPSGVNQNIRDAIWAQEYSWYREYQDVLFQQGSPRRRDSRVVEDLYDEVAAGLQALQQNEAIVRNKLSQSLVEIRELQVSADLREIPGSPVAGSSFGPPQATENADGSKTLTSGPSFDVDEGAEDALRSDLQSRSAQADQYAREIGERIQQVEAGVTWLDYILMDNASNAPLGYARDYANVLAKIQEQYARHGDLMLRQQDWLRTELADLQSQFGRARGIMINKSANVQSAPNAVQSLNNLIQIRAQALDELGGTSTIAESYLDNRMKFENNTGAAPTAADLGPVADSLWLQLWYRIADAGMTFAEEAAGEAFDSISAAAQRELQDRWLEHSALTNDIHQVMMARATLIGALYDLHGEYQRSLPDSPPPPSGVSLLQTMGNTEYAEILTRVVTFQEAMARYRRRLQLTADLQVPVVSHVGAISQNNGYMATELFSWEADHPNGVFEYLYNSLPVSDVGVFADDLSVGFMQSNGNLRLRNQYVLTPGRGVTSQDRTLRVAARGGAGYLGFGRASYQTRFQGAGTSNGPGTVTGGTRIVDTTPPLRPSVRIGDHRSSTQVYWTAGTETLADVRWDSWDYESGIQAYEYAVGSDQDTTLVRDWTPVGGRTDLTLRDLNLDPSGPIVIGAAPVNEVSRSPDSPFFTAGPALTPRTFTLEAAGYRVFVRALNGDSLWSAPGASAPIRVDQTAPFFPDTARITQPFVATLVSYTFFPFGQIPADPLFAAAYPVCPVQSGTISNSGNFDLIGAFTAPVVDITQIQLPEKATPVMSFTLPRATDVGSGVARYRWRIAPEPSLDPNADGWEYTEGTPDVLEVEGLPLVYGDSLTLSLAAEDGVGQVSEPIFYRFRVTDPTDPFGAVFCATTGSAPNRVRLRVDAGGFDPEAPVVAWDYRIRAEDRSVLQDFPAVPDSSLLTPSTVIQSDPLAVPDGTRVYAEIRVHNLQGRKTITSSGPLTISYTPPATPSVVGLATSQTSTGTRLDLHYVTRAAGTQEWTLINAYSGEVVAEGTLPHTNGSLRRGQVTASSPRGGALAAGSYRLLLRTVTSSGFSSAPATRTLQLQ